MESDAKKLNLVEEKNNLRINIFWMAVLTVDKNNNKKHQETKMRVNKSVVHLWFSRVT